MEHMSPARLGEAQLAENSWRPGAQVLRPVPHALAHGLQGKIAAPASVDEYKVSLSLCLYFLQFLL